MIRSLEHERALVRVLLLLLAVVVLPGCSPASPNGNATTTSGAESGDHGGLVLVTGRVVAGPTAPPTRDDPEPGTEPVDGAVIEVVDPQGRSVGIATSDYDGTFEMELPVGSYRFVPQPVPDLVGTPAERTATVDDGVDDELTFEYDTGIR